MKIMSAEWFNLVPLLCRIFVMLMFTLATHADASNSNGQMTTLDTSKLLCYVLTQPANRFNAIIVKETWGHKCDHLLFISSEQDDSLPAVAVNIGKESRYKLSKKNKKALEYIYKHFSNFDWFLKADDDTYIVMENLRRFLSDKNASWPVIFGRRYKTQKRSFMAGGAGYVLSREALRIVNEKGFKTRVCHEKDEWKGEDVLLGRCLAKVGVTFADTRDDEGQHRFLQNDPVALLNPKNPLVSRLKRRDFYPQKTKVHCCSKDLIGLHRVSGYEAKFLHFLLHDLIIGEPNLT